jgi:tetratricopeptide (TPR) repeat protein
VLLPIARQMAAALGAAHARGVVHRDFKGANVMLVPGEQGQDVRAVVTDFGLARGEAGGDDTFGTLHTAGRIAGTPAYMAPEQVTGGKVTPAIDVYALGVVLYELLVGRPPFVGESPLATAVIRLKENPPLPRTIVPDVDRRWEAVVLRCLEREPAARFASPGEVVAALEDGGSRGLGRSLGLELQRSPRLTIGLAAVALLLVAGGAFVVARRGATPASTSPSGEPAAPARPSVAVMGFKNLRGRTEAAWLSTAVAEALRSELAAGGRLRLLPGDNVERTKRDLALHDTDADSYPAETLERLRANLGSDWIVTGKYLSLGGGAPLTLYVHLQDARSHVALDPVRESGPEDELAKIVARCGVKLRAALGVGDVKDDDVAAARAAYSSNPAWAKLYAEGLEKLRRYDAPAARLLLERAVQADPAQPLGHWALAEAWYRLGYGLRAADSAKRALDLAGGLALEERLQIQARWHFYSRAWDEAIESYRTLWKSSDNVDYGLSLADVLLEADRAPELPELLQALRRLPAPAREDPRIDLVELRAAEKLSRYPQAVELAERVVAKARRLGASLMVADARLKQAQVRFEMGSHDAALSAAAESRRLYEAAGDRSGAAKAVQVDANVLRKSGRHDEAARLTAEAEAAFQATGDRRALADLLMNSAQPLFERGDYETAMRRVESALTVYRDMGDALGSASALGNLGMAHKELGQLDKAQARLLEAAEAFRRAGNSAMVARVSDVVSGIQRARGDLSGARASHETARKIQLEAGQKAAAGSSREALAQLLLDEGHAVEAEREARAALAELQTAGSDGAAAAEASALETLALACLANGKAGEGRTLLDQARARQPPQPAAVSVVRSAIVAARVQAAGGARDEALAALRAALDDARRLDAVELEFEARLALGELGDGGLEALVRDARRRGYELLARKAEQALRAAPRSATRSSGAAAPPAPSPR